MGRHIDREWVGEWVAVVRYATVFVAHTGAAAYH